MLDHTGDIQLKLRGSGGQSFGVFLTGLNVHLTGEANDYVGKVRGESRVPL